MNWFWAVKSYFFPPSPEPEYEKPWRSMDWSESNKNTLLQTLKNVKMNKKVDSLRILLHGPIGAGKSSLINSVDSVLQRHITSRALANSALQGHSFTLKSKTYKFMNKTGFVYPFTLTDISGIEEEGGIQIDDIIKMLRGHIQNGYSFHQKKTISKINSKKIRNPNLKDKIHCLVSVLPADSISRMEEDVINKMKDVRKKARDLGIPQVVIMTRIDEGCPLVKGNLQKVYTSKKIKEKMETCSVRLGVPVSYIYPVKNYHEEMSTNTETDVLILHALQNIVNFANDYVRTIN